jgi:repressor LexA
LKNLTYNDASFLLLIAMLDPSSCHYRLLSWIEDQIQVEFYSPTYEQMMKAMGLYSKSPIQKSLIYLKKNGYLDWKGDRSRTYQVLRSPNRGIPIKGYINAHSLMEPFTDEKVSYIKLNELFKSLDLPLYEFKQAFALRVYGDSMIEAHIQNGDLVIMQPCSDPKAIKDGTIVAAEVEKQTTLKYFYRKGKKVTLRPANSNYSEILVDAKEVTVQGTFLGSLRLPFYQ